MPNSINITQGRPVTAVAKNPNAPSRFPFIHNVKQVWSWVERECGGNTRKTIPIFALGNGQYVTFDTKSVTDIMIKENGFLGLANFAMYVHFVNADGTLDTAMPQNTYTTIAHPTLMVDRTPEDTAQYSDMVSVDKNGTEKPMRNSAYSIIDLAKSVDITIDKPIKTREQLVKLIDTIQEKMTPDTSEAMEIDSEILEDTE